MGFSFVLVQNKSQSIMKVLLLVALAIATVLAEPEAEANADPWYRYYRGYYGYPYVHRYGYYGYPHRWGHYLGKRSADPALLNNAPDDKVALYPGVTPYHFGVASIANNPVVGNPGYPLAKSYVPTGVHYIGKREAEANPEANADPEAEAWYGRYYGGYYGYPYGYGYYGYGHRYGYYWG